MDGYFYATSMTELAQVPAIGEKTSSPPRMSRCRARLNYFLSDISRYRSAA
jgi:hypothetical protein